MGLFSEVIRLKCISDHSLSFCKKYFCLKKYWSMRALYEVLDTSDDAKTHPKGPQTYLKQKSNTEIFINIFIVYDRLW